MNSPLQVLGRHSISVVTPVYNGDASIPELCRRLTEVLSQIATEYEIILVNDGSRDRSWETISELSSRLSAVRGLNLMRNYGQHNALLRGIRAAKYDVIVTVDDDLQHPAEEISRLLEQLEQGFDVVYGAPKEERHGFMRALASRITRLALGSAIGKDLARNVSAFRVFRTQLRDAFADYQTPFVSIDVLLTWATTRFTAIPVAFQPRYSGSSTYTFTKLVRHALDMMTGFSTAPLQLDSLIGFGCTLFGLAVFLYVFTRYCLEGSVPGFPFLASIIAIFSGAQLFALAPVFQGDHVPIRRIPEDLDDFAGKHPIATMQNSGSRFNDNSGHKGIQSPTLNYSGIPSGVEESLEIRTEMSRLRST